VIGFLLASLISSSAAASLQELRSRMKGVNSFEAQFTQTVKQDLFPDSASVASGRIMFTRPNKLQWIYEKPKKRLIKFDGKELTIEDERGDKQIIRDQGRITLERSFSFLWGEPDESLFKLEDRGASRLRLRPRRPEDVNFKWIELSIQKGRVASALVHDKLGGESLLEFQYRGQGTLGTGNKGLPVPKVP